MIGKRVRQLREIRGMTQTELAKAVGVGQSHISDIELDQDVPSMRVVIRLAEALSVDVGDLFPGKEVSQ